MKILRKTLVNLTFAAAFILAGMNAEAQFLATILDSSKNEIVVNDESSPIVNQVLFAAEIRPIQHREKLELRYWKKAGIKMNVFLHDANSNLIYLKELGKYDWGYAFIKYDIRDLKEGQYQILLQSGSEKVIKKFEIRYDSVRSIEVK